LTGSGKASQRKIAQSSGDRDRVQLDLNMMIDISW
jgi:hypothetical protein